jgi:hypothetical protein
MQVYLSTTNYKSFYPLEKFLAISFFILVINTYTLAQEFMMLKNGEVIEFNRFKIKETDVKVVTKDRGNLELKFNEITGYYNTTNGTTYYLKKGIPDGATENQYQFDKLILEGEINVYERLHISYAHVPNSFSSTPAISGSRWTELYLGKGSRHQGMGKYGIGKSNKEKRKDFLIQFIEDNQELVKQVEDENFKGKDEEIIRIVKAYNLSRYKPNDNLGKISTAWFYVKKRSKNTDTLKTYVNGMFVGNLPNSSVLAVNLSNQNLSKVCVNSYCEVIKASPYYIKYFEIYISDDEIKFTETEKNEAERYLLYLKNSAK